MDSPTLRRPAPPPGFSYDAPVTDAPAPPAPTAAVAPPAPTSTALTRPAPPPGFSYVDQGTPAPTLQKPQGRSLLRAAGDLGVGLGEGLVSAGMFIPQLANTITGGAVDRYLFKPATAAVDRALGGPGEGSTLAQASQDTRDYLDTFKSPQLRQQEQDLADTKGFLPSAKAILTHPALLTQQVAEQVPQFIAPGGIVRKAGAMAFERAAGEALAKGAAKRVAAGMTEEAATAAATKAAERVGQRAALKAGAKAAVATEAAISGSQNSEQAQQQVLGMDEATLAQNPDYQAAIAGGATPQQAREQLAMQAGERAAAAGAAITAATGGLTAGLESRIFQGETGVHGLGALLTRDGAKEAAKAVGKEFTQEALQEGGEQLGQNYGVQSVDPNQSLLDQVPEQAALGGVIGGVMGGGAFAGSAALESRLKRPKFAGAAPGSLSDAANAIDAASGPLGRAANAAAPAADPTASPISAAADTADAAPSATRAAAAPAAPRSAPIDPPWIDPATGAVSEPSKATLTATLAQQIIRQYDEAGHMRINVGELASAWGVGETEIKRARNTATQMANQAIRGRAQTGGPDQAGAAAPSDATAAAPAPADESATAPGTVASVPVMITQAMKSELRSLGHTAADIAKMTPQQAHDVLRAGEPLLQGTRDLTGQPATAAVDQAAAEQKAGADNTAADQPKEGGNATNRTGSPEAAAQAGTGAGAEPAAALTGAGTTKPPAKNNQNDNRATKTPPTGGVSASGYTGSLASQNALETRAPAMGLRGSSATGQGEESAAAPIDKALADRVERTYRDVWAEKRPNQPLPANTRMGESLARAIQNKDAEALRSLNIGDAESNPVMRQVFEKITGVALPKGKGDSLAAVDMWAGVSPEQRAEITQGRKDSAQAKKDHAAAKRAEGINIQFKGGEGPASVKNVKQYVDNMIAQGLDRIAKRKEGAVTRSYLVNASGSGVPLRNAAMREYAAAALRQRQAAPAKEPAAPFKVSGAARDAEGLRVKTDDGETNGRTHVDQLVAKGYTKVESTRAGDKMVHALVNEAGEREPIKARQLKYAKEATARIPAKQEIAPAATKLPDGPKLPDAPYNLTQEEIDAHAEAVNSYGKKVEEAILGDQASAWRKALRERDSSNTETSNRGQAALDAIEGKLAPKDVEALYGIGGDAQAFDDLNDFARAHSDAAVESADEAAVVLGRFLLTLGGTQGTDPSKWTRAQQVAYAGMRELRDRIAAKGWDSKEIQKRAVQRAAARFGDANDAAFMLSRFMDLAKPKEAKRAAIESTKAPAAALPAPKESSKEATASPIDAAAHEAATSPTNDKPEPTQAQKEAGNYAKGHVSLHGLDISIENPRGSERTGVDPNGKAWAHTMSDHYGYVRRTTGADGEQVDVYIGPKPESEKVFVVDQIDQETGAFDEHKAMLGFTSEKKAVKAYRSNFDKGWKVGPVHAMSMDEFKAWLKDGDTSKPAAEREQPAVAPPAAAVEAKTTEATAATNTGDAGAELWYNRRNRSGNGVQWSDLEGLNDTLKVKEAVKSKVWPRPDYEQLVADGLRPEFAHLVKQVYDALPTKPQTRGVPTDEQLRLYIDTMGKIREAVFDYVRDGERVGATLQSILARAKQLSGDRISMIDLARRPENTRSILDAVFPGEGKARWRNPDGSSKEANAAANLLGGNKLVKALQIGEDEFAAAIKAVQGGWPAKQPAWKKLYTISVRNGTYTVVRAGRRIATGLATRDEADAAAQAHYQENKKTGSVMAEESQSVEQSKRVGPDHRAPGENVSSDQLREAFGFRGVNFGNWMKGESAATVRERQLHLNHAYDAFMDLADITGLPPRALSLNGQIGLAFGAQGKGGRGTAHFIPGVNEINLTRRTGAGAIAHEWAHALDHYFAVQSGEDHARATRPYLTLLSKSQRAKLGVRPEISQAFQKIINAMEKRPLSAEEVKAREERALTRSADALNSTLAPAREALEKAAGPDAVAEFDALADRLRDGDVGEGKVDTGRKVPSLRNRRQKVPEIIGQTAGQMVVLLRNHGVDADAALSAVADADQVAAAIAYQKQSAEQRAGQPKPDEITSNYLTEARRLESDSAKRGQAEAYWSTPWEMFARAFQSYAIDNLASGGRQNDYLSRRQASEESVKALREAGLLDGDMFPRAAERARIGEAFATLFNAIKTEPSENGNVRLFSFAGERALTADRRALAQAQQMEAMGRDSVPDRNGNQPGSPEDTHIATGWHRGADGKWRFEIDDSAAKVMPAALKDRAVKYAMVQDLVARRQAAVDAGRSGDAQALQERIRAANVAYEAAKTLRLDQVLDHPELFAAYPDLAAVQVRIDPSMKSWGAYNAASNSITLRNPSGYPAQGNRSLKSVLLHEIQHAIQKHEGFARGGSAAEARTLPEFEQLLKQYMAEHEDRLPSWTEVVPGPEQLEEEAARKVYLRLAGEVEARNTQRRMGMTAEERRAIPASETADVARADQIVRFNGGPAMDEGAPRVTDEQRARVRQLQGVVDRARAQWKGEDVPAVEVVATPEQLPASAKVDESGNPDASYQNAAGFYNGRKIYIVASAHEGEAGVRKALVTMAHEAVGHYGIDRIVKRELGADAWQKITAATERLRASPAQATPAMREVLASVKSRYGAVDADTHARETLAVMAERGVRNGLLDRAVAAIRQWLRRVMPSLRLGESELRQLLVKSAQYLERGPSYAQRVQAQAAMSFSRDGWSPDFPDAVTAQPHGEISNHPDYAAAKAGDRAAALRLARDVVTPDFVDRVRSALPEGAKPIIVPVVATEASGDNEIPRMAAEVLAQRLGAEADTDILQSTKVSRGGSDAMHRLANQPAFDGAVQAGRDYVLLDDTLAQGGTLAQLKTHIERGGGRVVLATALTAKDYSRKLALDPDMLRKVRGRYGSIEGWWKQQFGYGFDGLTQSEARAILTYDKGRLSPDGLRNRVAAGKIEGIGRVGTPATGDRPGTEAPGLNVHTTATPAFRKWFSGSKVVDESGAPQVVYHGTTADFEAFSHDFIGDGSGMNDLGDGFYFTDRPDAASNYAKGEGGQVMPVYLAMKNPATNEVLAQPDVQDALDDGMGFTSVQEVLEGKGYDGIAYTHKDGAKEYVVFRPEQVKSAVGNRGTFDARDPRTAFSLDANADPDATARRNRNFENASASIEAISEQLPKLDEKPLQKAKDWIAGKARDFEPAALGALQLRHVLELASDTAVLDRPAKAYSELFQRMDGDRNTLTQEGAAKVDSLVAWARERGAAGWAGKIKPEAKALFKFMHAVTQLGVDPTSEYQRLTVRDSRGEEMPWTKELIKERIQAIRGQMRGRPGDDKAAMIEEIKDLQRLPAREKARQLKYPELVAAWNALTPEARNQFVTMRDHYRQQSEALEQATIDHIQSLDIPAQSKRAAVDLVRRNFADAKVSGVYFPLMRFGDYWISAHTGDGEYVFAKYESAAEQERAAKQMIAAGATIEATGRQDNNYRSKDAPSGTFMGDLMGVLRAAKAPEQVQDQIYQMYLKTLPELSLKKRGIHRKNIAGYTDDVPRAFASSVFHGAHQLSKARYGWQLQNTLERLRGTVEASRGSMSPSEAAHADALMGEINRRHDWILNPTNNKLSNAITSVGFAYFLSASPASALVNLIQVPQIVLPVLGAKHGWAAATRVLTRTMRDAFRTGGNIDRVLTGEDLQAFKALQQQGTFQRTATHSLAGIAEGDSLRANPVYTRVLNAVSWMFHTSEVINREGTGMAAFRLAREKGMSFNEAVKYADEITNGTHGDYSNANRARYMQGNVAKVLLQFKNYSLAMSWLWGRQFYKAFKGESPEVRTTARRTLTGLLGMTGLFAGVVGMPIFNLLRYAAQAVHAAAGDDDEPWDFMTEFRSWLAEHLGEDAAAVIADGPVSQLGANVASRVSMSDLWFRDADRQLEGEDAYNNMLQSLAGPTGGLLRNLYVGAQQFNEGHTWRGIETMLPTAAKNTMKAVRFAHEGVNTLRGDPIVPDVSAPEELVQALGFQPTRIASQQRVNNSLFNYQRFIQDRRQNLLNAFAMALQSGDNDGRADVLQRIQSFNAKYPEIAIRPGNLRASLRTRAQRSAQAENGIMLNKKIAGRVRQEVGAIAD